MNKTPIPDQAQIHQLVQQQDQATLIQLFESLKAKEIVYAIEHLSKEDRIALLSLLPPELSAEIIEEIPDYQSSNVIKSMEAEDAAAIIEEMASDEQADVLADLDQGEVEAILSQMDLEEAEDVRRLISYESESAGGLMITELIEIAAAHTVTEAIRFLRQKQEEFNKYQVKYLYVTDMEGKFSGVLQMHKLLLAAPNTKIATLAQPAASFSVLASLDELNDFFNKHDFFGVPVTDTEGRLVGVVLRRSVLEATAERSTVDYLETQGIIGGDELRTMPVWLRSRRRLSWLSVNILLNILAASVIAFHQDILSSVIALAVFLPIISDMSGCSGNQAVAVSLRELSIGAVRPKEIMRVLGQEASVGIINGLALGLLMGLAAWLWQGNIYLGVVAGGALALNTLIAVSLGGTVPLFLKGLKVDPALASGPILTTITDMVGFLLVLTFAGWLLEYLQ